MNTIIVACPSSTAKNKMDAVGQQDGPRRSKCKTLAPVSGWLAQHFFGRAIIAKFNSFIRA